MQTLEQLKAEQLDLEQKLAQNKQKQLAIFDAEFCEKNGFCVGDIVFFEGKKSRIIGFNRGGDGRPLWYKISLFRKDKSLGSAERLVYDNSYLSRQQKNNSQSLAAPAKPAPRPCKLAPLIAGSNGSNILCSLLASNS